MLLPIIQYGEFYLILAHLFMVHDPEMCFVGTS